MTLKKTYAVSTLKKFNVNGNDYKVLRYLNHGDIRTRVIDNLVMEAKVLLTEYREDERVENGDILDTAVIRIIVHDRKNDCTNDYNVHVSLADYSTDNYDVILKQGNTVLVHEIYDSEGGSIEDKREEYKEVLGESAEEVKSLIEDILFTYDPDEKLSKTVMLGLINPF